AGSPKRSGARGVSDSLLALEAAARRALAGVVRVVRPLLLQHPLRAVLERDVAGERPRALVAVLGAARVEPTGAARVRDRLGQLVARHVRERREALRVTGRRVARIAAGDAVDVRHVRDLDGRAVAAVTPAV